GPGRARHARRDRPRTAYSSSPEPAQARPIRDRPTGDPAHVERGGRTMGEAEHSDREALEDIPATVADHVDRSASTVGAASAESGPADLGAEDGDGKPATLGTGVAAGDATQQGLADLAAAPGAGATALTAADSPGSHAGANGDGPALR